MPVVGLRWRHACRSPAPSSVHTRPSMIHQPARSCMPVAGMTAGVPAARGERCQILLIWADISSSSWTIKPFRTVKIAWSVIGCAVGGRVFPLSVISTSAVSGPVVRRLASAMLIGLVCTPGNSPSPPPHFCSSRLSERGPTTLRHDGSRYERAVARSPRLTASLKAWTTPAGSVGRSVCARAPVALRETTSRTAQAMRPSAMDGCRVCAAAIVS